MTRLPNPLQMRLFWQYLFAGLLSVQTGHLFANEATEPAVFNRLFTTPAERELLEEARTLAGQNRSLTRSVHRQKKIVSFKGVLRTSDGSAVLFIDDTRVVTNDENADEVKVADSNDRITVKDEAGKNMAMLKPGQAYSLESGKYRDYFEHFIRPPDDRPESPGDPAQTAVPGSGEELLAR